jgi:predicted dehydrogenase
MDAEKVKVYQIGLGSFGRYGFEKLVDMHRHMKMPEIELVGVSEKDFEKRDAAEKFAEVNGIDLETFDHPKEMYNHASEQEGRVLVYDAGPSPLHAKHIYESMSRGFYHLAEKPPSFDRQEHIRQKELARDNRVMWKVDFIERESPVVKKAIEILKGKDIDSIRVFRESSMGIRKLLEPVRRQGVKGGDIFDKMIHEAYILDFLEGSNADLELDISEAHSDYFMPKSLGSDRFMGLKGGYTEDLEDAATARTSADFTAGDTKIEFNSSWFGVSDEARITAKKIEKITGDSIIKREHRALDDRAFKDEEARFFVIEGERDLAGDMLHEKLYNLDSGREIDLPELMHDQLYRVIEKAVLNAAGIATENISEKETDIFMNALFDVRAEVTSEDRDFYAELDSSMEKARQKIIEDDKILEHEESETLAG